MCIVIVKPAGVDVPDVDTLFNCWASNPDGAGFCVADGGVVAGSKGHMDFEGFILDLYRKVDKKMSALIHFRIGTHGRMDGTATHPFPLSNNPKFLRDKKWMAEDGVAHNGIIHGFGNKKTSDTQAFIGKVMFPEKQTIHRKTTANRIGKQAKGNKIAILNKSGHCTLIGDWIEDSGCLWSNFSYISRWNHSNVQSLVDCPLYSLADQDDDCVMCEHYNWVEDSCSLVKCIGDCEQESMYDLMYEEEKAMYDAESDLYE